MRGEKIRLEFRVVVYPYEKWWIAHNLETDVVAEGHSPDKAVRALVDLMDLHLTTAMNEGNLESIFQSAPPAIWRMYLSASPRLEHGAKTQPKAFERFEARELVES